MASKKKIIRRKASSAVRRRRSPLRRFTRKARRNPIVSKSFMDSHLQPAIVGALGALANDIAVGKLVKMLPAGLQKMEVRHLVKGVSAVALSMLASKAKMAKRGTINDATVGALTCVLHDAARAQTQKHIPGVALGEYLSEVEGPWMGVESFDQIGMGEYLSGDFDGVEFSEESVGEFEFE